MRVKVPLHLGLQHKYAVPRPALEVADTIHGAVVLSCGCVQLNTHPKSTHMKQKCQRGKLTCGWHPCMKLLYFKMVSVDSQTIIRMYAVHLAKTKEMYM